MKYIFVFVLGSHALYCQAWYATAFTTTCIVFESRQEGTGSLKILSPCNALHHHAIKFPRKVCFGHSGAVVLTFMRNEANLMLILSLVMFQT